MYKFFAEIDEAVKPLSAKLKVVDTESQVELEATVTNLDNAQDAIAKALEFVKKLGFAMPEKK